MYSLSSWIYQGELEDVNFNRNNPSVKVRIPARFDFIGGWTDTPPYYFDNPAAVLNASIDSLGMEIGVRPRGTFQVVYNGEVQKGNLPVNATVNFLRLNHPQIEINISNTIPPGSGLGGSSLLACGILAAIFSYYRIKYNTDKLINYTLAIEQSMDSGGGWQDQIGGLFSGVKLIQTVPERPSEYDIKQLSSVQTREFSEHCLLIDTDVRRKAANILYSIRDKYVSRDKKTRLCLGYIQQSAICGFKLLEEKKYEEFGRLMAYCWERVCEIESDSRIEFVDFVERVIGEDLTGLKIGGAGNGGFIMAIIKDPSRRDVVSNRLKNKLGDNTKIYFPKFDEALIIG